MNVQENKLITTSPYDRVVRIFDEDLQLLIAFGQPYTQFPYFIKKSDYVVSKNGKIYSFSDSLRIISEETGVLIQEFPLEHVIQIVSQYTH